MKKKGMLLFLMIAALALDRSLQNLMYGPLLSYLTSINNDANFPSIVAQIVEILLFFPIYRRFFAYSPEAQKEGIRLSPFSMVLIVIGVNGFTSLWMMASDALSNIGLFGSSIDAFDSAMETVEESSLLMNLIFSALLAPILEELLFRGIAFGGMRRLLPEGVAIFLSGLLFGLWHGIFVQVVYAAIAGIVFTYYYAKTRRLLPIILMHILNNFLSSILPYLPWEGADFYFQILSILSIPFFLYYLKTEQSPLHGLKK